MPPWIGLQPGVKLAKSMEKSPLKPVPKGSLPSPTVAVNGAPLYAETMVPNCQPPVMVDSKREPAFIDGRFHIRVPESTFRISKSHGPNLADLSSNKGTAIELRNVSPVTGAELKSWHFPNV